MFGKPKARVEHFPEADIVRIVADGLVSTAMVADGRMLPVLIVDTSDRPDIDEYIHVHANSSTGDVRVQWAHVPAHNTVILLLSFERPLVMHLRIGFRLEAHQGILVEQILAMGGFYLQAGREGDRLKTTMDRQRIVMEAPDTGFRPIWDKIFHKHTMKMLKERGLGRAQAKTAAHEAIALMRKTGEFRMPTMRHGGD
ncbi:MAG: hypothetical protein V4461_13180 [Pseudomonadota bacterium]